MQKRSRLYFLSIFGLLVAILFAFGSVDGSKGNTSGSSSTPANGGPAESSAPRKPDLEVLDFSASNERFNRFVVGTVRNNTSKTYSYVQIQINLLDKDGNLVGSTLDNVNNLDPGKSWKFKAIIMEDEAVKFEIKEVSGW